LPGLVAHVADLFFDEVDVHERGRSFRLVLIAVYRLAQRIVSAYNQKQQDDIHFSEGMPCVILPAMSEPCAARSISPSSCIMWRNLTPGTRCRSTGTWRTTSSSC